MKQIKFTSINQYYTSRVKGKGVFENPYVIPISDARNAITKSRIIYFKFAYLDENRNEIIIDNSSITFNEFNTETLVNIGTEAEPIEKEIIQAVTDGWVYDREKVISWGKPDYIRSGGYYIFKNGVFKFPEDPVMSQIAIDYILQAVPVEGVKLVENFEFEEII